MVMRRSVLGILPLFLTLLSSSSAGAQNLSAVPACPEGNLLARKLPVSWQEARRELSLLTDETLAPEGAMWDSPPAVILDTGAATVTWDLGVVTNLRFLRWLIREPVVEAGEGRTDTLDRIWPPDDWASRAAIPDDAWRTAAVALTPSGSHVPPDPWAGGWRLNAGPSVRLESAGRDRAGK